MDQSQGGNPFGRLIEFARPHKTGYIVSVVLAVLGVAFGIVPYFATARMTIELLSGNRDLSFYILPTTGLGQTPCPSPPIPTHGVLTATAIWPSAVIPVWSICFSARPAKPTRRSSRNPLSGIC